MLHTPNYIFGELLTLPPKGQENFVRFSNDFFQ